MERHDDLKIIQLTPGAGGMYCGNCFRDNALVTEFRRSGHDALMVPLYLPLTLDEASHSTLPPCCSSTCCLPAASVTTVVAGRSADRCAASAAGSNMIDR